MPIKDFKICKAYDTASGSNVVQITTQLVQKAFEEALTGEMIEAAKEAAREFIREDAEIREFIRDMVREALITVPTEVIRDAMRDVIREEMGVVNATKPAYVPPPSAARPLTPITTTPTPGWGGSLGVGSVYYTFGTCINCGTKLNSAGMCVNDACYLSMPMKTIT